MGASLQILPGQGTKSSQQRFEVLMEMYFPSHSAKKIKAFLAKFLLFLWIFVPPSVSFFLSSSEQQYCPPPRAVSWPLGQAAAGPVCM